MEQDRGGGSRKSRGAQTESAVTTPILISVPAQRGHRGGRDGEFKVARYKLQVEDETDCLRRAGWGRG